MTVITAAPIKQVREDTGTGMLDIKKALAEAEGGVARAKEIIRVKGIATASKREDRKAQGGTIVFKAVETANGKTGHAVELNSKTDFMTKAPKFVGFTEEVPDYTMDTDANSTDELLKARAGDTIVKLTVKETAALSGEHVKVGQLTKISDEYIEVYAHKKSAEIPPSIVAMVVIDKADAAVTHEATLQVSAMDIKWLTRGDVPADVIKSECRVATEKSLVEGGPEKIIPKIAGGRLDASSKEAVLLEQLLVKDPSRIIGDLFKEINGNATASTRVEIGKGEEE